MNISQRILSGVVAGWLQAIVAVVVSVVQVRLIFHYLPLDLTGVWFLFLTLAGYVALFDLGISPTLSREISFSLGSGRSESEIRQRIADLVSASLRIFAAISAGVLIVSLFGGLWFLPYLVPPAHLRDVREAWMVFAFGAAANVFGNAAYAGLVGLGNIGTERTIRTAVQVLYITMLYVALAQGGGMAAMAAVWVAHGVLLAAAGWLALRRSCPWLSELRGTSVGTFRAVASPSAKWAMTAFGSVLILDTDNVIIAKTLGTAAIPPYELIAKIATVSMYLASLISTSSAPFVSVAHARGDAEGIRRIALRNVRLGMGLMVVISAWVLVYAEPFVHLWVGPGQFVGTPVVAVFVVLIGLEAHHRLHATVSMAVGRLVFHWWALGAGVLNIALTLLLVGRYGLLGVALGSMIAQLLTNNWFVPYYTLRTLGLSIRDYCATVCVPLVVLLAVALASAAAVRVGTPTTLPLVLQLALGLATTMAASLTAFWMFLLDAGERAALLRLLPLRQAAR